jgi:DnaK suppressor protein
MQNREENRLFATRTWLLAHAAELRERVREVRADLGHSGQPTRDFALRNEEIASLEELDAIDLALERLDLGVFGLCEECGGAIEDGRIAESPLATRCVKCAPVEKT